MDEWKTCNDNKKKESLNVKRMLRTRPGMAPSAQMHNPNKN